VSRKFRSVVIGATGLAGQQFIAALADHPSIEINGLAASSRSAGKTYLEALKTSTGMLGWLVAEPLPDQIAKQVVQDASKISAAEYDLAFSAVEADVARELEPVFAKHVPVISTASAFRYEDDVPLLIPPINAQHASLVEEQRKRRNTRGFIVPIPNCTTTGLAVTLAPLDAAFGVESVLMTSMQAMSGAGRSPGVIGMDIIDNVVPYIPKEEAKVEKETQKILGTLRGNQVMPHPMKISCTCTRVPVLDGHTEAVFASLKAHPSPSEVVSCWREWKGHELTRQLPSAPAHWIEVLEDPFRPQPRLDRDTHGGMATTVGRLREDAVLAHGFKYVLVSHNTKMGAAKGAVLVAELLDSAGLIGR